MTPKYRLSWAALAFALACVLSIARGAPSVPSSYKPLWKAKDVDELCKAPAGPAIFSFNELLPAGPPSADLGAVPIFDCSGNGTSRVCALPALPELSLAALSSQPLALLGLAAFLVLHLVAALAVVGFTFCCMWCRYGGPAFFKSRWPSVLTCCAAYPTMRSKYSVTGFIEFPNSGGAFGYTPRVVFRTRVLVVGFLALLLGLVVSSYTAGSQALTANMLLAADAQLGVGSSVQAMLQSTVAPLQEFALAASDGALGGLLRGLNASLTSPGLSLREASAAMRCVNASFQQLPNASVALELALASQEALFMVRDNAQVLVTEVDSLKIFRMQLAGYARQLSGNLTLLGAGLGALAPPLANASAQAAALVPLRGALLDNGTGLLVDLAADLNGVGAAWPLPQETAAVTGASAASFSPTQLWAWPAAYANASDYNDTMPAAALASQVSILLATRLRALPDLNATAARLVALNASVNALAGGGGALAELGASLNATAAAIELVPPYATFADTLAGLNATAAAISFAASMSAVTAISDTLASLPDFPALFSQLARLGNVTTVLPCAATLVAQLGVVNATLYRLPSDFDGLLDVVALLNDTAKSAAMGTVALTRYPLQNSSAFLGTFNASALYGSFYSLQARVVGQREALGLPALFSAFSALNRTLTASLAATLRARSAALGALGASLGAARVSTAVVDALRVAQGALNTALNLTRLAELEYGAQARGHCTSSFNFCGGDGDCPVTGTHPNNTCDATAAGKKRCANNWFPPAAVLNTPRWWAPGGFFPFNTTLGTDRLCRVDADCSNLQAEALCVGDPQRATTLAVVLTATSAQRGALVGTAAATNATVLAAAAAAASVDAVGAAAQLSAAVALVGNVTVPSTVSQLGDLLGSFDGTDYDSITAGLSSMQARIVAVNTTSMLAVFQNAKDVLDSFALTYLPMVTFSARLLEVLQTVFVDNAGAYVSQLSRATLSKVGTRAGISGIVSGFEGSASVTGTLDAMVAALFEGWGDALGGASPAAALQQFVSKNATDSAFPADCCQQLVTPGVGGVPSLQGAAKSRLAQYVDTLQSINGYEDTATGGPIYYVASVFRLVPTVKTSDANALYVWTGRDGKPYSGGRLCLTAKCLQSTITVLNKSPLPGVSVAIPALEGPLSYLKSAPFSFSRDDLFLILWVPVLLAVLLGGWSLFARYCCAPARWQKVPPSCMIGCMVCQLPLIFLLLAVLAPVFILLANACSSGANLGYNALLSYGDDACALLGGAGPAGACVWALPVAGNVTFNVTADLPGAYVSVFGQCGGDADPLLRTFAGLAQQAREGPPALLRTQLDAPGLAALGPSLRASLLDSAAALSSAAGTLVEKLGNTSLSCGALQRVVRDVRETACARVVAPLYWYVGAWAAAAWAMAVVGFPVMCMARKRLPAKVWGPNVLAAVEAFEAREDAALLAGTLKASTAVAGTFPLAAAAQAAAATAATAGRTATSAGRTATSAAAAGATPRTPAGKMDVRTVRVAGKGERTATGGDVTLDVGAGGAGVSVGVKGASPQKK